MELLKLGQKLVSKKVKKKVSHKTHKLCNLLPLRQIRNFAVIGYIMLMNQVW